MLFKLRNIGPVEVADIEVKGLTVITGLNDTGKSFISKSIYSAIKTVQEASEHELGLKHETIDQLLRRVVIRTNSRYGIGAKIISSLRSRLQEAVITRAEYKTIEKLVDQHYELLVDEYKEVKSLVGSNAEEILTEAADTFERIKAFLSREKDDDKERINYLDRVVVQQLFRSQFCTLGRDREASFIALDGDEEKIEFSVNQNRTATFSCKNELYFQDATLIDTPLILQLAYFIRQQRVGIQNLRRRDQDSGLPFYYLDLLYKLPSIGSSNSVYQDVLSDIEKIISGQLIFQESSDNFVYKRTTSNNPEEKPIENFNIATGIKSFGILQLLINSGAINASSILIIDEPEVHLHPKWEIEYAKILVALCKAGIPIIISTHSPYFLKALKKFVDEYDARDSTKFYHGKKNANGMSTFLDVTEDLSPVFEALAKPMADII